MNSRFIKDALIAKEILFETEGVDIDTLYRMCKVIDAGILVCTNKLNKKYKTPYPSTPADFIGETREEYEKRL